MPVGTMALPKRWWREGFPRQFVRFEGWLDWVLGKSGGEKGDTYSGSGGPDTVEHVGSEGDGDEEVFRVANAHYVARFVLREPVCAGVHAGRVLPTIRLVSLHLVAGIGIPRTYTLQ